MQKQYLPQRFCMFFAGIFAMTVGIALSAYLRQMVSQELTYAKPRFIFRKAKPSALSVSYRKTR